MADKNHDAMIKGAYSALLKKQHVDITISMGNSKLNSTIRTPNNDELRFLGSHPNPIAVEFADGTTIYGSLGNNETCFGCNRQSGYAFGVSHFSNGQSNLAYNQKNIDIATEPFEGANSEKSLTLRKASLKKAIDHANFAESGRFSDEDRDNFVKVIEAHSRIAKVQEAFVQSYHDTICKAYANFSSKLKI